MPTLAKSCFASLHRCCSDDKNPLLLQAKEARQSVLEPYVAKCPFEHQGKRVVVNKQNSKFASAHDFRRAFGTRWASGVKPATLQLLMRHESIETTLKFYVAQSTDDVASQLWGKTTLDKEVASK